MPFYLLFKDCRSTQPHIPVSGQGEEEGAAEGSGEETKPRPHPGDSGILNKSSNYLHTPAHSIRIWQEGRVAVESLVRFSKDPVSATF